MNSQLEPQIDSGGTLTVDEKPRPSRDLRRMLVDLWRRSWMVAVVLACAGTVGWLAGKRLSKQTFEAETSLMFRLNDEKKGDVDPVKDLLTLKDIVKVRSNLEVVRDKLKLETSLQQLGASIDVEVTKNTNLMVITATSGTAEGAADIANSIRESFLAHQVNIDRIAVNEELAAQKQRYNAVVAELSKADLAARLFTDQYHITDFVSMARAYLEGYNSTDLVYQAAMVERQTNIRQRQNLERIVNEQKAKVLKEQTEARTLVDMTTFSTKIERLRTAIHDDQEQRARQADLTLREIELNNLRRLLAEGAVAKKRVDEAQAAYDKQKALTVDNDQVKAWRIELKKLEDTVLPPGTEGPAAQLLQTMLIRDFDVQIQSVAIEEKVASLKAARDDYDRKLSELPDLQREFTILQRRADALEEEKKTLDEKIAKQNRLLAIRTPDFVTVSDAKPPVMPKSSNKKVISIAAAMIVAMSGLAAVVGTIFLDTRLKSKGDLASATQQPVLAEIPAVNGARAQFPPNPNSELAVIFSALSRSIRRAVPAAGSRIVIAGIHSGDGGSSVAAGLATALTRQGERVLLGALDTKPNAVSDCVDDAKTQDWIAAVNDTCADLTTYVQTGSRAVPATLPLLPDETQPDLITSIPMRSAIQDTAGRFDVTLLDVLPAAEGLQLQLLGSFADGVVLVARSLNVKREQVRRVEADLDAAGIRVVGWVMNAVPKLYQEPV